MFLNELTMCAQAGLYYGIYLSIQIILVSSMNCVPARTSLYIICLYFVDIVLSGILYFPRCLAICSLSEGTELTIVVDRCGRSVTRQWTVVCTCSALVRTSWLTPLRPAAWHATSTTAATPTATRRLYRSRRTGRLSSSATGRSWEERR